MLALLGRDFSSRIPVEIKPLLAVGDCLQVFRGSRITLEDHSQRAFANVWQASLDGLVDADGQRLAIPEYRKCTDQCFQDGIGWAAYFGMRISHAGGQAGNSLAASI